MFGENKNFPDFFTRNSGFKAAYNASHPKDAALMLDAIFNLNVGSGMLIAVPIPEKYEADGLKIKEAIG